jgi:hypothetical protein
MPSVALSAPSGPSGRRTPLPRPRILRCDECPHAVTHHDAVGLRFCCRAPELGARPRPRWPLEFRTNGATMAAELVLARDAGERLCAVTTAPMTVARHERSVP